MIDKYIDSSDIYIALMEEKVIIGFDVDNCLRDFTEGVNKVFERQFPKYAYCLKDAWCWDWFYYYPWEEIMRDLSKTGDKQEYANQWLTDNIEEIQSIGSAYKGTIETLKLFIKIFQDEETEIVIVTCQRTEGAEKVTEEWIRKQGLKDIKVKFAKDWEDKWNHAHIIIDDSLDVLKSKPDNKVAIKVAWPWNKEVNGFINVHSVVQITPENIMDAITLFKLLQL